MTTVTPIDSARLREAMRRYPTGVAILTATDGVVPVGMTIASFVSASLDPPLVSMYIAPTASAWPVLAETDRFAIHLLDERAVGLANRFARSGIDRFAPPTRWFTDEDGVPALHDAGTRLRCLVHDRVAVGDHVLLVGLLVDVDDAVAPAGARPAQCPPLRPAVGPLLRYDGAFAGVSGGPPR